MESKFAPTNFQKWKIHEIQSYLLEQLQGDLYREQRLKVQHTHIKGQLVKLAKWTEQQMGVPAAKNQSVRSETNHSNQFGHQKRFIKMSDAHYDRWRQAQLERYTELAQGGGGSNHAFLNSHPYAETIGSAALSAESKHGLHVGSVAQSAHLNSHIAQASVGRPPSASYEPPSHLIARGYRNWNSPRDRDRWHDLKKYAERHNKPFPRTFEIPESEKDFNFDLHPEVDWPKYSACGTRLGRHCPLWCEGACCECLCDPCGEHVQSDWADFGVGHSLYFKYLVSQTCTLRSRIIPRHFE